MEDTPVQVSRLWSGGCHIWTNAAALTSIMAWEMTLIVAPFWPPGVYLSLTQIMAHPRATPILCQMKYISVHVSYLGFLVVTILANGPTSDFNSGPGNESNIGCILALQRLFESNLNNSPSPSHSNLVSGRVCSYSGLLLMVSWWVLYLHKRCRPDFNNGPGGDSNSDPVLAPGVYLSPTQIMAHSNLVSN